MLLFHSKLAFAILVLMELITKEKDSALILFSVSRNSVLARLRANSHW